jgi:hypothetical protein
MKKYVLFVVFAAAAVLTLLLTSDSPAQRRGGGGGRAAARPTPARPAASRPAPQVSRPTPAQPRPSPAIAQQPRPSPGIAQQPRPSPGIGTAQRPQARPQPSPGVGIAQQPRPAPGIGAGQKLPSGIGDKIAQRPDKGGGLVNLPKDGGRPGQGIGSKLPDIKGKLPADKGDFKDFLAKNKDKFPGDKLPGIKDKIGEKGGIKDKIADKGDWKDFLAKNKDKFPGDIKDRFPKDKGDGKAKFPGDKGDWKDKLPIGKGDWKGQGPIAKGGKDQFPGGNWKDSVPKGKFPVGDININNVTANNITQNFLKNSKTNFQNLNVNRRPEFVQNYNNVWQDRVGWRYHRGQAVRGGLGTTYGGLYRAGWWGRYPGFSRLGWFGLGAAAGYWWRPATWASWSTWVPGTWGEPYYYDYGGNIVYDNDVVYIQGEPVATATEYIDQAYQLASTGQQAVVAAPAPTTEKQVQEQWMPIGVFALCSEAKGEPIMFLQLTVSKQGAITGSFYNAVTEEAQPVYGSVDPKTQRAAWSIGENGKTVMETGVHNLTLAEAPVLVHFNRDRQQSWLMVRMDEPKEGGE